MTITSFYEPQKYMKGYIYFNHLNNCYSNYVIRKMLIFRVSPLNISIFKFNRLLKLHRLLIL